MGIAQTARLPQAYAPLQDHPPKFSLTDRTKIGDDAPSRQIFFGRPSDSSHKFKKAIHDQ